MLRRRKAKIVATLGPATSDLETVTKLFQAGVDVFRLNFSHGSHEDHWRRYELVREVERATGRPISVLADMQGPKLRVGTFAAGKVKLAAGGRFTLDRNPAHGDVDRVHLPHPELFEVVAAEQCLLLDDGKLRLEVLDNDGERISTRVMHGGVLSDRKGVNVPDTIMPIPVLTRKDRIDLEFALSLGSDWIALSFVQQPEDLIDARVLIGERAGLMVKLEKPAALDRLDEIVSAADAVMVARGDLGVELPPECVPGMQKRILRSCRSRGKPVIVATPMLESMISAPVPTRAEASDVATAIYDGPDAVMLSAESASGGYPVQAVEMMDRIIRDVERDPLYRSLLDAQDELPLHMPGDAICAALRDVAQTISAVATATYTTSGHTSLRAARQRPSAPILRIRPKLSTARRLALAWGVHSTVNPDVETVDEIVSAMCGIAITQGLASSGDQVAIAAGTPFGKPGTTNLSRIARV